MTPAILKQQIEAVGCRLMVSGGDVEIKGGRRLPPELVTQLRERKAELLALLTARQGSLFDPPAPPTPETAAQPAPARTLQDVMKDYQAGKYGPPESQGAAIQRRKQGIGNGACEVAGGRPYRTQ